MGVLPKRRLLQENPHGVKPQLESGELLDDCVKVTLATPGMTTTFWYDLFGPMPIYKVVFNGYAGDDQFFNLTNLESEAHGHAGNDILVGGSGKDVLFGDGGDDMLYGNGGDDELHGDTGLPPALAALLQGLNGIDGDDYL